MWSTEPGPWLALLKCSNCDQSIYADLGRHPNSQPSQVPEQADGRKGVESLRSRFLYQKKTLAPSLWSQGTHAQACAAAAAAAAN